MPRQARIFSESGYMHVYTRGNGQQIIFEQKNDYVRYLNLLKKCSLDSSVTICAFCLMENHVHFIVYDEKHNLSQLMRSITSAYSRYFNEKYKRKGHLFEGRFCNIPIENEDYLLTVFRYVLNNPSKAKICTAAAYPWNSYSRYGKPESFVDTSMFVKLIGSKDDYESFIASEYEDCPELEELGYGDIWAQSVIKQVLNGESGTVLQSYKRESRDSILCQLKNRGLTDHQIARLTGVPLGVIERVQSV